jgi:predicted DNA-binding transcriptional regulator YafY
LPAGAIDLDDIKLEQKVSNTEFSIFMRQLHVLALMQHSTASENMNYRTMADLLSLVPWDEDVNEKKIARAVDKLKEMGFPVHTAKGETRVVLEKELSDNEMLEVLPYYLNLVSDTVGIRDCFKSYVQNHGSRSLWIIGRIYFASLQKKRIELTYRSLKSREPETYILNPYRWVYRDNAVYLIARNTKKDISLFRLNRIRNVVIKDEIFDDIIPTAEDLLRFSMGAYISDICYNVVIRFKPEMKERIEEDFGHLDPIFIESEKSDYLDAGFTVCDLRTVCQAVFGYCGKVKIVAPVEAVEEMKRMLNSNIGVY